MRMLFDEFYYSIDLNPLFGRSPCMVFDEDDGAGDNDKGGGGGSADDKGGKADDKPSTFTLNVAGTEKVVTLEEMQELATKSAGADEKFRLAAEERKAAEEAKAEAAQGKEITGLWDKLFKSGEYSATDVRRFGELTGQGADEMEAMFKEEMEKQGKKAPEDKTPFRKLTVDDLDDSLKETGEGAKQIQVEKAEQKIAEMCEKGVGKDEFFGTILKDTDDKQREGRKAAINDMVKREVNKRLLASPYTGEKFGDHMINGAIQEIRANIKRYGAPIKKSEQPVSSVLAGLGLSGDLLTKVQDNETVERVESTDDNYIDNFVARLAQKQMKAQKTA
jgi:hypothetical protein